MEVGAENNISTVYKEKPEIPQIETWAKHLNRSLTNKWPVNMEKVVSVITHQISVN